MSNKPKIYSSCAAGCLWETVHKSDFERSAAFVPLYASNGKFDLEIGKEYKIFCPKGTDIQFTCAVRFTCGEIDHSFTFVNTDEYADSYMFKLLDVGFSIDDNGVGEAEFVYEIAGVRYSATSSREYIGTSGTPTYSLFVMNPTSVLLVNSDATVKAEDGDSAFIRYSANADGTDFTEEWSEGQNYIGFATGQSAPTDKSGYTWSLFYSAGVKTISGKYTWNNNKMNSNSDLIYGSNWSQKVNFSADDIDFTEMRVENGQLYYDNQWWAEEGSGICGSPNDIDFGTEPQTVSEEFYNIIMTCTNEGTGGGSTEDGLGEWTKLIFADSDMLPSGLYLFKICLVDDEGYGIGGFAYTSFTCFIAPEMAYANTYISPYFKGVTGVDYRIEFIGSDVSLHYVDNTGIEDRETVITAEINTIKNNTYYIKLA